MPSNLVDFVGDNYQFTSVHARMNFPNENNLSSKRLYEIIEPKLKTDNQKNAVRQIFNAYNNGEMKSASQFEPIFLNNCRNLAGPDDQETLKRFFDFLENTFLPGCDKAFDNDSKQKNGNKKKEYIPSAISYVKAAIKELGNVAAEDNDIEHEGSEAVKTTNVDKMINSIKTKDEQKLVGEEQVKKPKKVNKSDAMSEETQKYTKRSAVPDLDNDDTLAWFVTLPDRAKQSKGKMNSDKYLAFYEKCKDICNIVKAYKGMNNQAVYSVDVNKIKDPKIKKTLKKYVEDGVITKEKIKNIYENLWQEFQNSAADYVKYKLDDEGFTRDQNKKPGRELKRKSVEKFGLMDEVFGHKPRKSPINVNQIKM